MNIGGGEAADQVVRMMLSGGEVAVKLGDSALKNLLALTMALAKQRKSLSGKVNMGRMLRETRDLRLFAMTPAQYRQFKKRAGKQKILFSAIRDADGKGKLIDVVLPVTELGRANQIFERILYAPVQEPQEPKAPQPEQERQTPKKDSRSGRDSPGTKTKSSTPKRDEEDRTMSDKPSVEGRLKVYREQIQRRKKSAPAKTKTKHKPKTK